MPVHNALPHLDQAVDSIVRQSFGDFEFVILDDASTDGSAERLRHWAAKDERIRLIKAEENLGPVLSSQRVAGEASAPVVARMDADDVSHPERLQRQIDVLRADPEVGVVGSLCEMIDSRGRKLRGPEPWRLARRSPLVPFPHGTIMYRRALFDRVGGYRKECEFWEDQDLVARMAAQSKVMVIPRALYQLRQWTRNTRARSPQDRLEQAMDLAYRAVARLEQNRSYEDLLAHRPNDDRLDPRVFVSLGSMTLWAGGKPRALGPLLRRGRLSLDARSVAALGWAGWGSVSPASLRAFLKLVLRLKGLRASRSIASNEPVEWSPARLEIT